MNAVNCCSTSCNWSSAPTNTTRQAHSRQKDTPDTNLDLQQRGTWKKCHFYGEEEDAQGQRGILDKKIQSRTNEEKGSRNVRNIPFLFLRGGFTQKVNEIYFPVFELHGAARFSSWMTKTKNWWRWHHWRSKFKVWTNVPVTSQGTKNWDSTIQVI